MAKMVLINVNDIYLQFFKEKCFFSSGGGLAASSLDSSSRNSSVPSWNPGSASKAAVARSWLQPAELKKDKMETLNNWPLLEMAVILKV